MGSREVDFMYFILLGEHHPVMTNPDSRRWLGVLEEEFFRQGDKEREAGLPISPLFDRAKQGVSKSQVSAWLAAGRSGPWCIRVSCAWAAIRRRT